MAQIFISDTGFNPIYLNKGKVRRLLRVPGIGV